MQLEERLNINSSKTGGIHVRKYSNSVFVSYFVFFYVVMSHVNVEQLFGVSLAVDSIQFRGIELILFVFGWSICLFHLCVMRHGNIIFPRYLLPLFLLVSWSAFRLYGSPDIQLGIRATMQLTLFLLVFLVFLNFSFSERFVHKVTDLLFIVIAVQLFVSIYQIFNPVNAESVYSDIIRSRGMLGSGNGLAFFSLFLFAIFYPLALQGQKKWWIGCGMALVCILLSQTRIALGILFVVIVAGYWLSPIRKSRLIKKIWFIVGILFLVVIASWVLQGSYSQRIVEITSFESISSQGTLLHRLYSWQKVFEELAQPNYILGAGGGASEHFLRNLKGGEALDTVHNEYIKLQADYGIIGLLLFIWWLTAIFIVTHIQLKKHIKRYSDNTDKINLLVSSLLVIIIFSLGSLMHNLIYAHEISVIGWMIVGISLNNIKNNFI